MEWRSINTTDAASKRYHLVHKEAIQMILKYNLLQQSIRLNGNDLHQVFHVESGNRWNTRMAFKNVYGIEVGRYLYNDRARTGKIDLGQISLQYAVAEQSSLNLVLYKQDIKNPLLVCALPDNGKQQPAGIDNLERACLVLGLGWYCTLFFNNPSAQYHF